MAPISRLAALVNSARIDDRIPPLHGTLKSCVLPFRCILPVGRAIHQYGKFAVFSWEQHICTQNHTVAHPYGEVSLQNKMGPAVRRTLRKNENGTRRNQKRNAELHRA